jgi:hypothetical protein
MKGCARRVAVGAPRVAGHARSGARRTDNVTIADMRVAKGIRLSGSRRIAGFVDVFNLLNANPEQTTSLSSGTFLRPLSIVPPRNARLGMKLDW